MPGDECFKCHQSGHFARNCPNSQDDDGRGARGGGGGGEPGRLFLLQKDLSVTTAATLVISLANASSSAVEAAEEEAEDPSATSAVDAVTSLANAPLAREDMEVEAEDVVDTAADRRDRSASTAARPATSLASAPNLDLISRRGATSARGLDTSPVTALHLLKQFHILTSHYRYYNHSALMILRS